MAGLKEQGLISTPSGSGKLTSAEALMKGAPKYSYGLAVPMPGFMLVLFQRPPPLYIWQVNIPGMSEAGAMVQGISSLLASVALAEMIWRGNLAPRSL